MSLPLQTISSVPTLFSFSIKSLGDDVEKKSKAFYQKHPVCVATKICFKTNFSLITYLWTALFGKDISPAEKVARSLPETLVSQTDASPFGPRIISALERTFGIDFEPSWKNLFTKRFHAQPEPTHVSYKNAYILHSFFEAFVKAGRNVSKIPQEQMALFTENAPFMQGLEIRNNPYLTDELLTSLAGFIPSIKVLNLSGVNRVTPRGLQALVCKAKELEHFQAGSTQLDKQTIKTLGSNCKNLKSLDIRNLKSDVSLADLQVLLKANPQIHTLKLGNVQGLNDTELLNLLHKLPKLKHLELSGIKQITPNFIDGFFRKKGLDCLAIDDSPLFRDEAITATPEHYSLKTLSVRNCPLTNTGLALLKTKFPYLNPA